MRDKILEIFERFRGSGSTTWILNAALKDPNIIIFTKTRRQAEDLKHLYDEIIKKTFFLKRIIWKFFKRKKPIIISVDTIIVGMEKRPIVFDNYALF